MSYSKPSHSGEASNASGGAENAAAVLERMLQHATSIVLCIRGDCYTLLMKVGGSEVEAQINVSLLEEAKEIAERLGKKVVDETRGETPTDTSTPKKNAPRRKDVLHRQLSIHSRFKGSFIREYPSIN